jgi:hypothetical protein
MQVGVVGSRGLRPDGTLASDRSMMSLVVLNDKRTMTKEAIDLCSTCNVLKSCTQVLVHLTSSNYLVV